VDFHGLQRVGLIEHRDAASGSDFGKNKPFGPVCRGVIASRLESCEAILPGCGDLPSHDRDQEGEAANGTIRAAVGMAGRHPHADCFQPPLPIRRE
jgi:hypothetical protein